MSKQELKDVVKILYKRVVTLEARLDEFSKYYAKNRLNLKSRTITPTEASVFKRLNARGMPIVEIAHRSGRTRTAVSLVVNMHRYPDIVEATDEVTDEYLISWATEADDE